MNYSIVLYILGSVLKIESVFMILPCIVALIYGETSGFAYAATMAAGLVLGFTLTFKKPKNTVFYTKEGFLTVALSWLVLSIVGGIPFYLSGEIPLFIDAIFESVSGFTTTGSSILSDVESLSHATLFWRSFSHWLGGMGVLVFLLAIVPLAGGYNMHLMRAESPGPSVGKLVPRVRTTAKILYGIYLFITVLQMVFLLAGGMPLFETLCTAFGTAGTGGFGFRNDSFAGFSPYIQTVCTVFMILFGINFNVYFLFLVKKPKDALRCEEMHWYLGIIAVAIILITWNTSGMYHGIGEALNHSAFQVASIITTTGFSTVDFNLWPTFSKIILFLLMFIGACAGSTGGGIKVSRILILLKSFKKELMSFLHPRSVKQIHMEGRKLEPEVRHSVTMYLAVYFMIFALSIFLIALNNLDFTTTVTSVAATLNNIGPGLSIVGPAGNFGEFSVLSKIILIFDMLAGRLELFPMLLLFTPWSWKK